MDHAALILAAGNGKSMNSQLPCVLHPVCGKPILQHVTDTVKKVCNDIVIVVSEENQAQICEQFGEEFTFVKEASHQGWGTGRAVLSAVDSFKNKTGCVIISAGDMPLVSETSYKRLIEAVEVDAYSASLLYDTKQEPHGYGRVVRDDMGTVLRIVEQRELTVEEERIHACNASVYCFRIEALLWALPLLKNDNSAQEYYLTDVIGLLASAGHRIRAIRSHNHDECLGANTKFELALISKYMRNRINDQHMKNGVTLIDPHATYIDSDVTIGSDTVVYPGCFIQSGTSIGRNCTLLPNSRLDHAIIGDDVTIESAVITHASVKEGSSVGPFAYIRPNSQIGKDCRIGDFVEIKNSSIDDGTKVSHLTYVGDSDLGKDINLGCGVVFVNYNGKIKQRSKIEDHAFIGCNVNLVAPVHVGKEAYIAAGSTVTRDVPEGALLVARTKETIKEGWVEKRKLDGKL